MNKRIVLVPVFVFLAATIARGQSSEKSSLLERVGDTGFVRVEAESFSSLDVRQQQLDRRFHLTGLGELAQHSRRLLRRHAVGNGRHAFEVLVLVFAQDDLPLLDFIQETLRLRLLLFQAAPGTDDGFLFLG